MLAPLPLNTRGEIEQVLAKIASLPADDLIPIGAATTMFHGALLLFDRDVRSAYTLLVAGVEILSRFYGSPPMRWTEWDESDQWDEFIAQQGLTPEQQSALRERLLANKQLRLKATFRAYASTRLRPAFWDNPWVGWWYGIDATQGQWTAGQALASRRLRDVLPEDRAGLSKALGLSYDLRSSFVHRGTWIGPLELTLPHEGQVAFNAPLPFAVLRAVLGELISAELEEQSSPTPLPEIRLMRPLPH